MIRKIGWCISSVITFVISLITISYYVVRDWELCDFLSIVTFALVGIPAIFALAIIVCSFWYLIWKPELD